jgi:hypothetical protein
MKNKEFKLAINVVLIFISVLLIYGIFSPWITVATIFNVSGTSSVYGLFVFVSAFMFIVYGLTGLLQNSVLSEYQNLIRKATMFVSTFTLLNLMYLIYRYLGAIKEFNNITDEASASTEGLGELGQSLDNLFQNITNALKPTIGLGFYIILIGIIAGLILSIPVLDNKNIRLDKFGKFYSVITTVIIIVTSLFIFSQTRTELSTSADGKGNSSEVPSPSENTIALNTPVPEVKDILVSKLKLTLVWNPVFDNDGKIIDKYEYRMKSTLVPWSNDEPILCDYSQTEKLSIMGPSDTFSCDWDLSEVALPESEIKLFATNESYGLSFQLRAISDSETSEWSEKPAVLYLYEHPEFLGQNSNLSLGKL